MPRLFLLLLPLSVALASPSAEAARKDRRKADAAQDAPQAPAVPAPEGSIWDYIEAADTPAHEADADDPVPVDTAAVEASQELAEARAIEAGLLSASAAPDEVVEFYTDPAGTLASDPLHLRKIDPSEFDIPIVVNDAVVKWMEYFTGRGRKYYARYLSRSTKYQPMMREKLRAAGLPEDLVYLSMIESGYNPHAYSSAHAAGLWQFITSTGRMYDLEVGFWVDQRRDPQAATDAAIRLLGDLHDSFGDWYLAWAAYNAGPGRITRAKKRLGDVDFWTMVENDSFRPETDNYVPKLLAAAIIAKHPERYGFTDIEYQEPDDIEAVEVGPSISLDVLARCAGVTEEELQGLNPHLRRWALPPEPAKQTIYLPRGRQGTFLAALEKVPPEERLTYVHHKVSKGETLGAIASKYGVRAEDIQKSNRISNPNRIYVGMNLVIPKPGMPVPEALTASAGGKASPSSAPAPSAAPAKPKTSTVTHTVQKGEALSSIAAKYGVSTRQLQDWNGIRDANHVYVGQRLKVQTTATSWTSYTVRQGDTLSSIAKRYGVSIGDVQGWNDISGSRILVGQRLRIKR
ncbi:MAG: LysM peptidoglycan-binding domain-containing protein [Alphaproteobacteria bacterium]|nr:LysM peptidoglycan-binding domain-containing protein [Alphaproteobacteria bacterium]